MYSINMTNTKQNNEIEHIKKEISFLQDRLKISEESLNQFQNGLMQIGKIWLKKGKETDLSQTKEIQNILKNIFQNKIKQIKKNVNLPQNTLAHVKKRKKLFEKGLKKMQNLSQFAEMRGQSRDELKNYEELKTMKKGQKKS